MFPLLELPREVLEAVYALVDGPEDRRALRRVSHRSKALVDSAVSAVVHLKAPGGNIYAVNLPPVSVLCAAPWSLRRLVLFHLRPTLLDMDALSSAAWPLLEELSLENCCVGNAGVTALRNGAWPGLRVLNLSDNALGDAAAAELAAGEWPNLERLELREAHLTAKGAAHLASARWPKLQLLDVSRRVQVVNCLGAEGAAALSQGHWPDLRQLRLAAQCVKPEGLAALATAAWPKLESLDLSQCYVGDDGAAHLAAWPGLEELDLSHCSLGDAGIAALVGTGRPKLRTLRLTGNILIAPALGRLEMLEELGVSEMVVDAEFGAALVRAGLPRLRTLCISLFMPGLAEELVKGNWEGLTSLRVLKSLMNDGDIFEEYTVLKLRWPACVEHALDLEEESDDGGDGYGDEYGDGYGYHGGAQCAYYGAGDIYGLPSTSDSSDDY